MTLPSLSSLLHRFIQRLRRHPGSSLSRGLGASAPPSSSGSTDEVGDHLDVASSDAGAEARDRALARRAARAVGRARESNDDDKAP